MPHTSTSERALSPDVPSGRCRHCGDACPAPVTTADGEFCCDGCAAAFELITAHGCATFYAGGPSGMAPRSATAGSYAVLDVAAVASRLVSVDRDQVAHVTFRIPAIHCASCVWLLEHLWRIETAVCRADVDLVRRTVRIAFRPADLSLRTLAERLAALGYPPVIDAEPAGDQVRAERRTLYLRLGVAGFAFGNVMLFSIPRYANGAPLDPTFQELFNGLNLALALPVLLYSAAPWFTSAWRALRARAVTLDVPVALGLGVLFARSVTDIASGRGEGFLDSFSGLVFFLLIGRLFQQKAFASMAFDRGVRSFLPLSVRVERGADVRLTPVEELVAGDLMIVRPHEVVPADAVLVDANGLIDYAFTTGESTPAAVARGTEVAAGGRVVGRALRLLVSGRTSQSRLVALWDNPVFRRRKAHWLSEVSSRFGVWFTVATLALAAAGAIAWWPDAGRAAAVATAVLIIACPCALTLAAPIALGTAMGVLGRAGCYLKHPAVVLDLSRIDAVAFDKTGTLTAAGADDAMRIEQLSGLDLQLARRLAAESIHPVSRALAGREVATGDVTGVHEIAGRGIVGQVDGRRVTIGTAELVNAEVRGRLPLDRSRTWVAIDGTIAGWIDREDRRRPGTTRLVRALNRRAETWLLSGDRPAHRGQWSALFGTRTRFGMTPAHKLAKVRRLQAAGRRVLMVGDGLNDAGALAAADVGLAVSDDTACLVPACDAVIGGTRLAMLPSVLRYARRARRVILACFGLSLVYNAAGIAVALSGQLTPLVSAILMPISSLTVIAVSVGAMRWRPPVPGAAA
jgi:Cu+-exporting ATPase